MNYGKDLIKLAHQRYFEAENKSYLMALEWGKTDAKSHKKPFNAGEFANLKPRSPESCIPKQFSINNAIKYIQQNYLIQTPKIKIRQKLIANLTPKSERTFRVAKGINPREYGSDGNGTKNIKYDLYTSEDLDNFVIQMLNTGEFTLEIKPPKERLSWKDREEKYQKQYGKSVAKDQVRQRIKLKVESIRTFKDYTEHCICCNRALKKAVYTDKGIYGFRCYLTAIGIPTVKPSIDLKDFPKSVFDEIAETAIQNILKTDIKILANSLIPDDIPLEFPILYRSFIFFRFSPLLTDADRDRYNRSHINRLRDQWNDVSFICEWTKLWKFTGLPSNLMEKVLHSDTFNKWLRSQQQIARENSLGLEYTPFLKEYGKYRHYGSAN